MPVLLLLLIATYCDLRSREIPDWISVVLLGWGAVCGLAGWSDHTLLMFFLGAAGGLLVAAPFFYLGGFGGGDVKLVTAIGGFVGPIGLVITLFWIAIAGGGFALVAKLRGKEDLAYVPAILVGTLLYFCFPLGVPATA